VSNSRIVDVIVPVYNAVGDARRCVEAVLACTGHGYRLIVIDDASSDPAVGRWFDELAARGESRVTLLRNDVNLGFVGTTNRGMALSRNDVVLLNSDAVVGTRWLDKMVRCVESDPRIGTVTPFSNNAEICSFPRFCVDNPWPADGDVERVNRALESVAVPAYPELPTGVGFCMYIRREVLDRCGLFDAVYGRGYGEENDLCMRAAKVGFRNLLCDDTFVVHLGSKSFDADKIALGERNLRILLERHPEYIDLVQRFIAADPFGPLRDLAVMRLRALASALPGVLHVVHAAGGGTEHHARSLASGCAGDCRHYVATVEESTWRIVDHAGPDVAGISLVHAVDEPWERFLARLRGTLRIDLVHLHNVSGARDAFLDALPGSGVPYGYTVHDLNFACPTITFLDAKGRYCQGETDPAACRACLTAQPAFAGVDVEQWRARHRRLIGGARFLIAPSAWAAGMLARYFGRTDVRVVPHANLPIAPRDGVPTRSAVVLPADDVPTVAVVGAIGPDKGARRLERLVDLTRSAGTRVRWVVIGYVDWTREPSISPDGVLTIHGPYDRRDLPDLFAHYRVRLVAYPSACPETFSYTLSEAWSAGLPAIVPPIGALAERVSETGAGWIFDDWTDEAAMLAQIGRVLSPSAAAEYQAVRARVARVVPQSAEAMRELTVAAYRAGLDGADRVDDRGTITVRDVRGFAPLRYRRGASGLLEDFVEGDGGAMARRVSDSVTAHTPLTDLARVAIAGTESPAPAAGVDPGGTASAAAAHAEAARVAPDRSEVLAVIARLGRQVRTTPVGRVLIRFVPERVAARLRAHLQ
jgi:GT2 family glycosyltransferase/glycosyltransferase involved in cell wall biosynthesis